MPLNRYKITLNKGILFLYSRKQLIVLTISLISLLTASFNLIGITSILSIFSTFFIVIFLPFYPLFFIIIRKKNFNLLERLSLTIIANLTLYILSAYIGDFFGIPINGFFFLILIFVIYLSLVLFIIIKENSTKSISFLKPTEIQFNKQSFYEHFSPLDYFKRKVPIIGVLLIIFLILLAILNGVRFSYFYGTDAMWHVFMTKIINNLSFLPADDYFGALGLHIFAAVINFFSGIEHFLLAKFFSFYTYFISALITYNILRRIFKDRNLAFLGVFLLEFSSLGFGAMMYQFWPTALATIQSLYIFFLLYCRLEAFIKEDPPTKKDVFSNLLFTYSLIIFIYIGALFTHSLIATIYLVSFFLIFLIYFVKSYKRGFDFIILCVCLGLFIALFNISGIKAHWKLFNIFDLPWYILVFGGIIGLLLVLKLRSGIHFEKGRFKSIIFGQKYRYYKIVEDKLLFPLFLSFLVIFLILLIMLNINLFHANLSKTIIIVESLTMIFFGIWGLTLFQKKPKGKPLALWLLGLAIIYLGAFSLDIFVLNEFWSGRILLLLSPVMIFGFISYVYKLVKLKSTTKLKFKVFILAIVIFSFFAQFTDQLIDIDDIEYSLYRREVYSLNWYVNYTSQKNLVICEFGIPYVILYYDYPFNENNRSISPKDDLNNYFIQEPKGYFKPADHFYANGTNKLQQMKENLNLEIYLILDDNYLAFSGFEVYERLSAEELAQYYNLVYLNRVISSKSENGIEFPYYWVI
ncbi:MAG: hypothetical protein ACFE9P_05395 [Candidatus Hermodarchaeota archaeon]